MEIILAFDNDKAGQEAVNKAHEAILASERGTGYQDDDYDQYQNNYVHPRREELRSIFNITYPQANLMRRKYVLTRIVSCDKGLSLWYTHLSKSSIQEEWFVNENINRLHKELESLRKELFYLRKDLKDHKFQQASTDQCGSTTPVPSPNFTEYDKDRIKQVVSISRIMQEHGHKVQQRGTDKEYYKCPFHNEKTASFVVNLRDNYYKCFGCQEAGDVIKMYQHLEGLEFREALKELNYYI